VEHARKNELMAVVCVKEGQKARIIWKRRKQKESVGYFVRYVPRTAKSSKNNILLRIDDRLITVSRKSVDMILPFVKKNL